MQGVCVDECLEGIYTPIKITHAGAHIAKASAIRLNLMLGFEQSPIQRFHLADQTLGAPVLLKGHHQSHKEPQ
jgi:hypothetical protein